jgi:hypothetical protein
LVNGNLSQIQPSPGDWSNFLPPTSWSGGSDPVIAAVGDGAYGTMLPQSVVTSIVSANPALFLYLGDVYEMGPYRRLCSHYGTPGWMAALGTMRLWLSAADRLEPRISQPHPLADFWHPRQIGCRSSGGVDSSCRLLRSDKPGLAIRVRRRLGASAPRASSGSAHPPILKGASRRSSRVGPVREQRRRPDADSRVRGRRYAPMDIALTGQSGGVWST